MKRLLATIAAGLLVGVLPAMQPPASAAVALKLFVEPKDGVAPVLDAIASARSSVDLEVYLLTDRQVLGALDGAAKRGIQVRVLLERHPFGGGARLARKAYDTLEAGGCQVRWSDPAFTYTHEKAMVVDDREALIMTCNLSMSAFSRNREYGLIDRQSADVAAIRQLFDADWSDETIQVSDAQLVVSPQDSRPKLFGLMSSARHELWVQDEEVADPASVRLLGQQAKAGVDVRVELPASRRGPSRRMQAAIASLRQAGVRKIRLVSQHYLHAKLILADGKRAYLGSVNLSETSLDHNREVGRILDDAPILARLRQVFLSDWSAAAAPQN